MKKLIILAGLLLAMANIAFADQESVIMKYNSQHYPSQKEQVNRTPMHLPIEVVYDSDTHKIEVSGDESLEAEVFLYDENGIIVDYSSSLNSDFTVLTSGIYIIQIQGDGWYAEGEIEI